MHMGPTDTPALSRAGTVKHEHEEYPLPLGDYKRYGRQMILDGFGLQGQVNLSCASVAVVGAGGLGCPALQYLAAAGVGKLGIFDADTVDLSNLQRQVLHTEAGVGTPKVLSAKSALLRINSKLNVEAVTEGITAANALSLLASYDLILDCTDNVPTRYLLSDAAVALGVPLVSGAAQRLDGQLCVYNMNMGEGARGPCYRCIFPTPPKPSAVGSCEELGVLGGVTGVIGALQAVEAVKILTGMGMQDSKPTMTIYNALSFPPFRSIKMRPRREACIACGTEARESRQSQRQEGRDPSLPAEDYVLFCGGPTPDWELQGKEPGRAGGERVDAKNLQKLLDEGQKVDIIDVRNPTEFSIVHLPGSRNVPLRALLASPSSYLSPNTPTIVTCRLGNDSKIGAEALRTALVAQRRKEVKDKWRERKVAELKKAKEVDIRADDIARRTSEGDAGARQEWEQGQEEKERLWQELDNEEGAERDEKQEVKEWKEGAGEEARWRSSVMDLVGGLRAWSVQVDAGFPQY